MPWCVSQESKACFKDSKSPSFINYDRNRWPKGTREDLLCTSYAQVQVSGEHVFGGHLQTGAMVQSSQRSKGAL